MEETYTAQAIVLDRQSFRENDLKITIYSRDRGKENLVARGGKKLKSKLAAHLEPLNLINIMVVRGRKFNYVGSAISYNCLSGIKNNLEKINLVGRATSLIKKLIKPQGADRRIYNLFKNFLEIINYSNIIHADLFYFYFSFKLLSLLGYEPELHYCVRCRIPLSPENNKFSLKNGGVVCPKCISKNDLTISVDCIKILRLILTKDLNFLAKININTRINKEVSLIIGLFLKTIVEDMS